MTDLRDEVKEKPFRFSTKAADFLKEDAVLLVPTATRETFPTLASIPTSLLQSIQGISFFAVIKALEEDKKDVGNAESLLKYLRIRGNPDKEVNPDTQRAILSILHGLHAYFTALNKTPIPSLGNPLHERFRSVVNAFDVNAEYVQDVEHIFTTIKRRYLNQGESESGNNDNTGELMIRDIITQLQNPAEFWDSEFFQKETGYEPIPEQNGSMDTETVRDFYVARIPLATSVLGK